VRADSAKRFSGCSRTTRELDAFYELAGWREDGGFQEEERLGTLVREVRYRIAFGA
jgi:hypothetical protein